jgi:4-amino-4-deoxy-L-arabinose transferase-like glycosyltransferase
MAAAETAGSHRDWRAAMRSPQAVFGAIFAVSAIIYCYHLGTDSLGASEAYSAMAAALPSIRAIIRIPVPDDPGKQVLYYSLLHYWTGIFGMSELAMRSLSVIFMLAALALLFAVGRETFDDATAVCAVAAWALNPVAIVFAHRARMYSMFAALALAQLLMLWRVRKHPAAASAVGCGILGATLIYTHMGGLVIVGTEVGLLAGDLARGRRTAMAWLAVGLALALWLPWLPIASSQGETLVAGHWLDWIAPAQNYSIALRSAVAALGVSAALLLCFAPSFESDPDEGLRWCLGWGLIPIIGFAAGSIAVRPMFHIRYVLPSVAVLMLAAMAILARFDVRVRNLAAAGALGAMLFIFRVDRPIPQIWGQFAAMVERQGAADPVFFESGFVTSGAALKVPNRGFPFGYYSVPFNYYCHRDNPRVVVPAYDPEAARAEIESRVAQAGGGWLVSWKSDSEARPELPSGQRFRTTVALRGERITIYRIVPVSPALSAR